MAEISTILGSGVIGRMIARELYRQGRPHRVVDRHGRGSASTGAEAVAADVLDPAGLREAIAGSDVVYCAIGLPYSATVWEEQWPLAAASIIDACARTGSRLVFFDNVYAYGAVDGWMTEDTPYAATSRKGRVRMRVATEIMDAHRRGDIQACIARSADFYGPDRTPSMYMAMLVEPLLKGGTPRWIADPTVPHSLTYTPDAGRYTALLGMEESAYGQVWHLPTVRPPLSAEILAQEALRRLDRTGTVQVIPGFMRTILEWFIAPLRESKELSYQITQPYLFSSEKIERQFGWTATPLVQADLGMEGDSIDEDGDLVVVYRATMPTDAHVVAGLLRDNGVDASVMDEASVGWNPLASHALGGVRVMVRSTDLASARAVLDARSDDEAEQH
jgi:nucleoside-diphosphate-sugar epimerase